MTVKQVFLCLGHHLHGVTRFLSRIVFFTLYNDI